MCKNGQTFTHIGNAVCGKIHSGGDIRVEFPAREFHQMKASSMNDFLNGHLMQLPFLRGSRMTESHKNTLYNSVNSLLHMF